MLCGNSSNRLMMGNKSRLKCQLSKKSSSSLSELGHLIKTQCHHSRYKIVDIKRELMLPNIVYAIFS
jgi:hypothetical protein